MTPGEDRRGGKSTGSFTTTQLKKLATLAQVYKLALKFFFYLKSHHISASAFMAVEQKSFYLGMINVKGTKHACFPFLLVPNNYSTHILIKEDET